MKTWLIVDAASLAAIQTLNAGSADCKLSPVTLTDGRQVLPSDLLTDCGPGDTWSAYNSILTALAQQTFDITSLLPVPPFTA